MNLVSGTFSAEFGTAMRNLTTPESVILCPTERETIAELVVAIEDLVVIIGEQRCRKKHRARIVTLDWTW